MSASFLLKPNVRRNLSRFIHAAHLNGVVKFSTCYESFGVCETPDRGTHDAPRMPRSRQRDQRYEALAARDRHRARSTARFGLPASVTCEVQRLHCAATLI